MYAQYPDPHMYPHAASFHGHAKIKRRFRRFLHKMRLLKDLKHVVANLDTGSDTIADSYAYKDCGLRIHRIPASGL